MYVKFWTFSCSGREVGHIKMGVNVCFMAQSLEEENYQNALIPLCLVYSSFLHSLCNSWLPICGCFITLKK